LLTWARFPRTSWLVAAALVSFAGLGLRLVGSDFGPALAVLAIVALGLGGGFASPAREAEAWFA